MHVSEFLDRLEALGPWELTDRGMIQQVGGHRCTGQAGTLEYRVTWVMWPRLEGPTGHYTSWHEVFMANDNRPGHDPIIRQALLDATGLGEKA